MFLLQGIYVIDHFHHHCLDTQPLSFDGNSFASWHVTVPTERRMAIKFDIKSTQSSGATLVYAEGLVDYSIVEVSVDLLFLFTNFKTTYKINIIIINSNNITIISNLLYDTNVLQRIQPARGWCAIVTRDCANCIHLSCLSGGPVPLFF